MSEMPFSTLEQRTSAWSKERMMPKDPSKIEAYLKRQSEATKKYFEDPENHKKLSISMKKKFEDPEYRENNKKRNKIRCEDPIVRKKLSESHIGYIMPEHQKISIGVGVSRFYETHPEKRKEVGIATRKRYEDPNERKKQSDRNSGEGNPNYGKKMSEDQIKKLSIAHTGKVGPLASNWKGGISYLPYCPKFNKKLKEDVRGVFKNVCVLCGKTPEENRGAMNVHHVFTEKMACCESRIEEMDSIRKRLPKNISKFGEEKFTDEEIMYIRMMVPLCNSCHGRQNNKSEDAPYEQTKYRKFFAELIINKYGGKCYSGEN